jgi:CDP-paratose 2-epimerase
MLAHHFRRPLSYIGFGGTGKQVRDLLHVEDLLDLVEEQVGDPDRWAGQTANVGGGRAGSLSLLETTALCREITGRTIEISSSGGDRQGDIPIYISDCTRLHNTTDWRPLREPTVILADIHAWIIEHESALAGAL